MNDFNYKQCKVIDCPYVKVKIGDDLKQEAGTPRLKKLTKAMEFIKQAYSFDTNQILFVMGNLYDFVLKNYPDNAKLVIKEA